MITLKTRELKMKRKQTLEKEGKVAQTPRFSAEDRLKSRFYEPLVLLHVLDRNGQRHFFRCPSEDLVAPQLQLRELRRTFLGQLAYVCDYIKGGDTVTAMALETQPSGTIFWVASNTKPSATVILFLQGILKTLQRLASSRPEERIIIEDEIAQRCIDFNLKRIKTYQTLMKKPLQKCLESLRSSGRLEDRRLAEWPEGFQGFKDDLPGLCRFSYKQRSCQYLPELQRHIGDDPLELDEAESRRQAFLLTRHYIGRLGSHLKAAKILTTAGCRMPGLLDNFDIQTRPSPNPPSLPPPTDQLTTLNGIIKRMLPADSAEILLYQEALATMDARFDILKRLQAQFQDKDFAPRVHAELNLLEHFYRERLRFVDDDRFIACSKPACYCCYHYISLHPGGFVRPSSHGIRYLNWRAPDLVNETDIGEKNHQRDMLNKVAAQIRLDALRQIEQRKGPSAWHPDSTTGITYLKKENLLVGDASGSQLPSDKNPLSDDSKSLNDDKNSSKNELSLGDDRFSNINEMSSSLEHTSNNLQPFFRDPLNISLTDIGTLVEGLCSMAGGQPSIAHVKDMIRAINAMAPQKSDLLPLLPCNILPIRRSRAGLTEVSFQNSQSNFAVTDRTKLAEIFEGHVGFLDFSLEEVRQLDPFVQALGLSQKFLSSLCTEETTCTDDGILDSDLTERFIERAYFLLRCAVSNRSPLAHGNPRLLLNQLLATVVLKTDGISTQYKIQCENEDVTGPITQSAGFIHIQEQDYGWKIFVPKDRDAREVSYMRELPHALTKLFKITESASENIGHVLNSSFAVIDELLEQGGISKVPGIEPHPKRAIENSDYHRVEVAHLGVNRVSPGFSTSSELHLHTFPEKSAYNYLFAKLSLLRSLSRSPSPNGNEMFTGI